MSKQITVLITAAGNPYMPGTCKAIKENGYCDIRLIGADMNDDQSILLMCDDYYQVPKANDPKYLDSLLEICKKENVDVLLPVMSAELELLANNVDKFEQLGTKVSISSIEAIKIANDKLAFLEFMDKIGLEPGKYYEVNSIDDVDKAVEYIGIPCVFKACESSGSRGMRIVDPSKSAFDLLFNEKPNSCFTTLEDFKRTLSMGKMPKMLAMEYLPGNEYTLDLVANKGKVECALVRRGLNVSTSIILDCVIEYKPEIVKMCSYITEKLKLTGNIGFDIKERADGTPIIMECNPRITAGVCQFTYGGVNLLYMAIAQALNLPLPNKQVKYDTIVKRRYMEMIG